MPISFPKLSAMLLTAAVALPAAAQAQQDYQRAGVADNMPVFQQALKAKLTFPMAWSPQVKDLPAWRSAGRAKLWELTLQAPDNTPFQPQVIAEIDRGSYVARQVVFNLSAESRVRALMLVPKGAGPFPAALMLHDHGGKFDIGKEKAIQPWGDGPQDAARLASSQAWADKHFSGRYPGDALARRGYVVLAVDALGWHPYFNKRPDTRVQFRTQNRWEMGTDKLPTHPVAHGGLDQGTADLTVDHCFDGWDGLLTLEDSVLRVRVRSALSRVVVFTTPQRDNIAVEPVSHVNNALNLMAQTGARAEDLGVVILQPGQSFSCEMRIEAERAA
eukprot:gene30230-34122_t